MTSVKVFKMTKGNRLEARLSQPPKALMARTSVTKLTRLPAARVASSRKRRSLLGCRAKGSQRPQTYQQCNRPIATTGQKNSRISARRRPRAIVRTSIGVVSISSSALLRRASTKKRQAIAAIQTRLMKYMAVLKWTWNW